MICLVSYMSLNYYKLFLDKSKHGTSNILGELSFDDINSGNSSS